MRISVNSLRTRRVPEPAMNHTPLRGGAYSHVRRIISYIVVSINFKKQKGFHMWSKKTSGLIGIIIGSIWLLMNFRHVAEQGFVAIGMPLVITVLGIVYFFKGSNESK